MSDNEVSPHPAIADLLIVHMRRTSGDVICTICGLDYWSHPDRPYPITCPTLVIVCSGSPKKL